MVNWIILIALFLFLLLFFRARNMQHRIYAVLIIILVILFYTTSSRIIAENNIDVKTFDGMVTAGKVYVKWIGHAVKNVMSLTGDVINMDWKGNVTGK